MIGQRAASLRQRERGVGQRSEAEAASGSSKSRTLFRRRFQFLDTRTKFSAIRTRFQGRFALSPWINPVDISSKCIQCFAVKEGVDCSLEANGRLSFRVVLCRLCALLFRLFFRCARKKRIDVRAIRLVCVIRVFSLFFSNILVKFGEISVE